MDNRGNVELYPEPVEGAGKGYEDPHGAFVAHFTQKGLSNCYQIGKSQYTFGI